MQDSVISEKKVRNGKHPMLLVDVKTHASKKEENQNLMLCATWKVLKDQLDAESVVGPLVRQYLTLPVANPDVPGHEAPTSEMFVQQASAFFVAVGQIPEKYSYPVMTNSRVFIGSKEIPNNLFDAAKVKAGRALRNFLQEHLPIDQGLLDEMKHHVVAVSLKNKDGSPFPNLGAMFAIDSKPEDWKFETNPIEEVALQASEDDLEALDAMFEEDAAPKAKPSRKR